MLYRLSPNPIAFIDESYETRGDGTFYLLGLVLIAPARLGQVRNRIAELNAGHPIHASALNSVKSHELLDAAVALLAFDHDSADIIFSSPLQVADISGEKTRQKCLAAALVSIQKEFSTTVFVLDSRSLKDADDSDRRTASDLRRAGALDRNTRLVHAWPREELLLSLPDVLAWSFRQTVTNYESRWFEPLRPEVRVTQVKP
jgi:hypothetical protein